MATRTCARGHAFTGEEPCPLCWPGYRTFTIDAEVWLYAAETGSWHFLSTPEDVTKHLQERFAGIARGWGSLKVTATIGGTSWETSIFPDKKRGSFLLPIKAAVRKAEHIEAGNTVHCTLAVHDA